MSIMDIFRPRTATPEPQKVEVPAANPTVPGAEAKSDGTGPAAIPKAAEGDKSPLANFADLWQDDPKAKPGASWEPTITIDPAKLQAAAKGIDFTKSLSPEALKKAATGDEAALAQIVNEAAQAGFAQSAGLTGSIVKKALTDQAKTFRDELLPEILRKERIGVAMRTDTNSELFDNPAVAPMLKSMEDQLAKKFPTSSPAEIRTKATEFLTGFAESVAATSGKRLTDAPKDTANASGGEDWEKYFSAPTPTM